MKNSRFRCKDLRMGRYSAAGQIYMITTITANRACRFTDFNHGRQVVQSLRAAIPSAETLAFVVMPDHLHWLMQLNQRYSLAQTVQFVKSTSARNLNRLTGASGSLWSKGYFEHALRQEEDVIDCARYIVANPLRAGLVSSIGEYPLWDAMWLGD